MAVAATFHDQEQNRKPKPHIHKVHTRLHALHSSQQTTVEQKWLKAPMVAQLHKKQAFSHSPHISPSPSPPPFPSHFAPFTPISHKRESSGRTCGTHPSSCCTSGTHTDCRHPSNPGSPRKRHPSSGRPTGTEIINALPIDKPSASESSSDTDTTDEGAEVRETGDGVTHDTKTRFADTGTDDKATDDILPLCDPEGRAH